MRTLHLLLILAILTLGAPSAPAARAAGEQTSPIYTDALAAGWQDWSWAAVNFSAGPPVHSGSHSIAVTYAAWTGLYLHNANVDTQGFEYLRFFIHGGGSGGQQLNVFLNLEVSGNPQNGPAYAVPPPPAGAWSEVLVPLTALNPEGRPVTGITWQDASGHSQPTLYIDNISLYTPVHPDAPALSAPVMWPRAALPADPAGIIVRADVTDPQGLSDIAAVSVDAAALGAGIVTLRDDGRSSDGFAGDGVYGAVFTLPASAPPGEQRLLVTASDQANNSASLSLGVLTVLGAPGGSIPAALPQRLGWGSNAWSETPGGDWQVNSGVPWNYVYQYITYGWETWGGSFVQRFVGQAWNKGYIPVVTVYLMLGAPPDCGEGGECYASKLKQAGMVNAYITSLENAAQEASGAQPVIFAMEPDFYGFMQQLSNSSSRPPGVQADNPASYPVALNRPGYANNLAGFGRYLVDRIHTLAPNALVAPMASMWATNADPLGATPGEAAGMAQRTAAFIDAMSGPNASLLVVEWSDRDAGRGIRPWWDDTDQISPRPTRALLWENVLSRAAGKRLLLWQVPVGNMGLNNVCTRYQDNRAAYLFNHPRELFEAGVFGIVFGGGDGCSTQVTTDDNHVGMRGAEAYAAPPAPTGLSAGAPNGALAQLRWNQNPAPDLWKYRLTYQPAGGGSLVSIDAGRRNALTLALPGVGAWELRVYAIDALGFESSASAPLVVAVSQDSQRLYLPLARR